ncbi:Pollen receptor-like kinase 3 [Dionaea muscipula]
MAIATCFKHPLIILYGFFLLLSSMVSPMSETDALLQFKNSLQNVDALKSWMPGSAPCIGDAPWVGIVCFDGIVTGLRLEGMGLTGKIDINSLSKLPTLRTISIMNNKFTGNIPEFNRLSALKAIYLSGNQFSGEIPTDYFATVESMKKVFLSNNQFTGEIPASLAKLRNLLELHLEDNQFTGAIPPDLKQPPLVSFNVSNNRLAGQIPAGLLAFNSSSFNGNSEICGQSVGRDCVETHADVVVVPSDDHQPPKGPTILDLQPPKQDANSNIVATAATVSVVIFSLAVVVIFVTRRKDEEEEEEGIVDHGAALGNQDVNEGDEVKVEVASSGGCVSSRKESSSNSGRRSTSSKKGGSSHGKGGTGGGTGIGDLVIVNDEKGVFGLADLMKAAAEVLGNGGTGSAYKATMANGVAVVVKRMKEMNKVGKESFDEELRKLAGLKHWNILPPLAYHYRKEEKLVVYEYISKGSLLYLLHGGDRGSSRAQLDWPARLKIILGVTRGMCYLHRELSSYGLPHGNLKSSNILINEDNSPMISEYGFSSLINTNHLTQALFAYKSPEALLVQNDQILVTSKSDVYCLGVVILEIVTGKYPSQYLIASNKSGGIDVVQWVASAIAEDREAELLDPEAAASCENAKDQMVQFLRIGLACADANPDSRPDMTEVLRRMEEISGQQDQTSHDGRTIQMLPSLRDGIC